MTFANTIVALNLAGEAVACGGAGEALLACCDVYGNEGGDWIGCIADQQGTDGNFSLDPAFCEADSADYHLGPDSPCGDAPGCGLVGSLAMGCTAQPQISVSPDSIELSVGEGGTATATLEIQSGGRRDLEWLIRETNVTVEDLSDGRARGAVVRDGMQSAPTHGPVLPARAPELHLELAKGEPDPRRGDLAARGPGRPDEFGYSWNDSDAPDGPEFAWRDISGVGAVLTLPDDGSMVVPLPFDFPFYGVDRSSARISSNGYITFGPDGNDYGNDPIPDPWSPNGVIAAYWDDLNPELGGAIYYYADPSDGAFIIQYDGVPDYFGGGPYTFEIVLEPNGSMLFQYLDVDDASAGATIGIEDDDGGIGLEVAFNSTYVSDSLAVLIEDPAPWLTESPPSGTGGFGCVRDVVVSVDAGGLGVGTYSVDLVVESNDPDESEITVPVVVRVTSTGIDGAEPKSYALHGNFPNPFNPATEIRYDLPVPGSVDLTVYTLAGRKVRALLAGERQGPGRFSVLWDGRDERGRRVASGVYFYRLVANEKALTRKMVLLK